MTRARLAALALAGAGLGLVAPAYAQQVRPARPPAVGAARVAPAASAPVATAPAGADGVRAHFGVEGASRLLRSLDPGERVRGLERLAAIHTPEALALLERAASATTPGSFDPHAPAEGVARKDPRALLVVVRGLAAWNDDVRAREALAGILGAQTQSFTTQLSTSADPALQEALGLSRVRLAREQAAIALAASGHPLAFEALLAAGRAGGPAQEPALEALSLLPPTGAMLGGVTLTTTGMIALAASTGDLRALDSIEGVLAASDPVVRAAALAALGLAGDWRVRAAASASLQDHEPRVRIAAADALVRLGAPEGPGAVEALIADETTLRDGLRLAQLAQSPGIVRAASARAAASSDDATRSAALVALGRQVDPLALEALMSLAVDPKLSGDAADALARSPAVAAMGALERLGASPATRRLALRAYFVRRSLRGERSSVLDGQLAAAAAAGDAGDRAVATQALVAFGEKSVDAALSDPDVGVQRAAAMGALSLPPEVVRRLACTLRPVHDEAAQRVLAFLVDDADDGTCVLPTRELLERARGGGADAPLAAMALARREGDELGSEVDALLSSTDPVMRAHVARGLGGSHAPDASGRLARAYAFETDVDVRRAVVAALALRTQDAAAPARRETLSLAARLDPDRVVRRAAAQAEASVAPAGPDGTRQVAWIRLLPAAGAALPRGTTATVTGANGLARPVVFDDDGYALVGGLPSGEIRLRLASRVTAYDSP